MKTLYPVPEIAIGAGRIDQLGADVTALPGSPKRVLLVIVAFLIAVYMTGHKFPDALIGSVLAAMMIVPAFAVLAVYGRNTFLNCRCDVCATTARTAMVVTNSNTKVVLETKS